VAAEELGTAHCGGVPLAIGVQTDMCTPAISRFGSDELKRTFLAPAIAGDMVGCIGVSEVAAGSDVAGMKTTAKQDGDDYVINGSKMWITNSPKADFICLLANTSGQFSGDGWLSWQQQSLRVALQASGKNLAFEDWQLDQLSLQVETSESDPTWQVQLDGQSLHNQQLELDIEKISIGLEGDLNNHQLKMNLTQAQSNASTIIQGSWNGQQWQGELSSFQLVDSPFGNWHLQQAVPILLSADQLSLKKLSVHSDNGGEVQLQGDYRLKQQQGTASIFWQNLDLSLFDPLIPGGLISGLSDGSVNLERGEKNRLQIKITTHGEIQYQQLKLKLEHSKILFNWDKSGYKAPYK
jgi:hypothetical protein